MPRVLIIKLGAIGDVVMLIPAALELHKAGHVVDWVCGAAVLPILRCYPWINPIVVDDRALIQGGLFARLRVIARLWSMLVPRQYLLAATLYYDSRYRVLAWPVRAGRKLMLMPEDRRVRLLPGRHHTDEYARILLDRPDGVCPHQLAPVPAQGLPKSPLPRRSQPRVVLVPAGAKNSMADDALRRWPIEHYVLLTRLLLGSQVEVVLLGGPDDGWAQEMFAGLAVLDLIGALPLVQTLAVLDDADVTVTHDTGPLHLAGMTSTGIIAIFGPTDPRGRLPQRPGALALWGGEGFACRPCYDGRTYAPCPANDCMRQVTPEMVFGEIMTMLADRAQGYLAPPQIVTPQSTVAAGELVHITVPR